MSGGIPARRAVLRWAWRLFCREWRQQSLVITLLASTVAVAVGGTSAGHNAARPQAADFGAADHRIVGDLTDVSEPQAVDAYLRSLGEWFGTVDVIGHRRVPVPGSTESVELRAQHPEGPYGRPMLTVREGRYPVGAAEVAVTDEVARTLRLAIGDTSALTGDEATVVGLVENPYDLDDDFVLTTLPTEGGPGLAEMDALTVLVEGSREDVTSFPVDHEPEGMAGFFESRGDDAGAAAGAGVLVASTMVLLLVCLVSGASFVVVAQRRLRQLGMLSAMGATRRHLRLVVVANGALVGAVAAAAGVAMGLVGWLAAAPRLENAVRHRIDRFDLPWTLVGLAAVLAVAAAGAAAWWPARTVSRVPVLQALSGRPPRPRRARRSLVLALALLVVGVVCLVAGIDTGGVEVEVNDTVFVTGLVAVPLGIALLCPQVVRLLAPAARWLPVASRLALRDLARYQARSGAALAAISLGLGLAVITVVAAAAAVDGAGEGNLSDRQLLVWVDAPNDVGVPVDVPRLSEARLERLDTVVDRITAGLDRAAVVALDVAVDPGAREPRGGEVLQPPVYLGQEVGERSVLDVGPLYVATPQVLEHAGIDAAALGPSTEVLTPYAGALAFVGVSDRFAAPQQAEAVEASGHSSAPRSLITPEAVYRHGWETERAAWLIEVGRPLSPDQLAAAREMAAAAGLTVEARSGQEGLQQLRLGATGAGMLLGLGILSMTVGLIRSEAAGDLRTLAAAGAPRRIRRTLTGATAGALAFLGALLGMAGAYAAMAAGYSSDIGQLLPVPVTELVVIAIGLPLLAAAAGWLLAGREPPSLARAPID